MATVKQLENEAREALASARKFLDDGDQPSYNSAWASYETKLAAYNAGKRIEEAEAIFPTVTVNNTLRDPGDSGMVQPVTRDVANKLPDNYMQLRPGVYVPYASKTTEGYIRNNPASVQLPEILARMAPGSDLWNEAELQRQAFSIYARKGAKAMEFNDEKLLRALNALQEDNDAEGGYLVPADQRTELIHNVGVPGGILRGIARVLQTSRDGGTMPTGTTITWGPVAEEASPTESNPAFGQIPFTIRKSGANIKVSEELLADSAINIPAFIGQIVDETSGVYEDQQGIEGDGATEPLGLRTTGAAGAISATNVTAAGVTLANMLTTWTSLPAQFRRSDKARVFTSSSYFAKMAGIAATGGQLWMVPSAGQAPVPNLYGIPIEFFDGTGWDDAATISATEVVGAIGDFNHYVFMDRVGVSVRRDDSRYADSDQVLFRARKRYDSFYDLADAFRLITGA